MPNPVAAYVRPHGDGSDDHLVRKVPLRDLRLAHNAASASPRPRPDSMRSVEEFTSLEALTNGDSKRLRIIRGWIVAFETALPGVRRQVRHVTVPRGQVRVGAAVTHVRAPQGSLGRPECGRSGASLWVARKSRATRDRPKQSTHRSNGQSGRRPQRCPRPAFGLDGSASTSRGIAPVGAGQSARCIDPSLEAERVG